MVRGPTGGAGKRHAGTAYDLGRELPFDDAVVAIDALCPATGLQPDEIAAVVDRHRGGRGLTALRRAIDYVDGGAESPQETRTRLLIVQDGLPRPETQIPIRSSDGTVVARVDMGWREWQVAVEYDGAQHWTDPWQRSWDIDRQAMAEALGWRMIRVSGDLLHNRPWIVLERIRHALRLHGAQLAA